MVLFQKASSIRNNFIIWVLLLISYNLYSQNVEEVIVTQVKGIGYDESLLIAKEKAINDAKRNALNRAGISENINAYSALFQAEIDNNYSELFTSHIFTNIRGAVKNVEIISESRDFVAGDNIKYEVVINGTVIKYNTEPDPMYKTEIKGISPFAYEGDLLKFSITTTKDSWLYVFCIPRNPEKAYFLFPNDWEKTFLLESKKTYEFPQKVDFVLEVEEGEIETTRLIFVLTKKAYPFTLPITYKNITEWIFTIPPDQRIVESYAVSIIRRE